jgi:transposase
MVDVPCFVGLDVAQAQWDLALRPTGERWAVPNDARGIAPLVDRRQALQPTLIVLEAAGGREPAATAALAAAGLPVVVGNPRQARDGARATGPLAKTEALEAHALAPCADVSRPTPRPLPDAQPQALRALRGRRQPLIGMRPAAQHRLAGARERLTKDITAPRTWRKAAIAPLDNALETRLRASPLWRANDALGQRAQGLGPVRAPTVRLALPALWTRTRQQSAAWVGVAPLQGARGTMRGKRTLWGGRAHGRTVLSMRTRVATRVNPQIKAFYERLLAAGKVKKVILTACRHTFLTMLNALLKPRTPWQPQEGQS